MNRKATCPYCSATVTLTTEEVMTLPRDPEDNMVWYEHTCSLQGKVMLKISARR